MALTAAFIDAHIANWEARLQSPYYPHRQRWPSRLFHHSPLENAIKILRDGNLRSRADPENSLQRDVAAEGVIDARDDAYRWVRLYFRPRTPTQWHIEGIRQAGECKFGENAHAPVLFMFVFDAKKVLIRAGVHFCDRNMQRGSANPSDTEEYFVSIPFEKVYHEGGIGGDHSIIQHRCAEVLAPSPLPLIESLQWICCRSAAERATLLHFLGRSGPQWERRILVSEDLKVFQREFVFVEEVVLSNEGISFRLNPRSDRKNISVSIKVWGPRDALVCHFSHSDMPTLPDLPAKRWIVKCKLANPLNAALWRLRRRGRGSWVISLDFTRVWTRRVGSGLEPEFGAGRVCG